ncbi:MAG: RecQ family ATP-dependent DNA helicase [Lentisphaeria bacterium]|nr:RecQ family ATP-dependent DNA helicase [Lentisphaeria bacterium]
MSDLQSVLREHFGHEAFLEGQESVIARIVAGEDICVIMPTGAGKSLCYQLPAMVRPGYTLVISPLISLMKDQVDALIQKKIPAACINSAIPPSERQAIMQEMYSGTTRLLYVAPERLRTRDFRNFIAQMPPELLVIDEAHCISQWGHDFRPDYARIGAFVEESGIGQVTAFTATATPVVKEDILQQLRRPQMDVFVTGFTRPNLAFTTVMCRNNEEKFDFVETQLRDPQPTIIYASTRKNVDELGSRTRCITYHAGLPDQERHDAQDRFMDDACPVIAATNAFGMGIDRPDIRRVVHFNIPGSLEAYYQEAGRAGRDGEDATCSLLFSHQDRFIHEFLIEMNNPPESIVYSTYRTLQKLADERDSVSLEITQAELAEIVPDARGDTQISAALKILEKNDYVLRSFRQQNRGLLRLNRDFQELYAKYPKADSQRSVFIHGIINRWTNDLSEGVPCTYGELCGVTKLNDAQVKRVVRALNGDDILWVPPFAGRGVNLTRSQIIDPVIDFTEAHLHARLERQRLEDMMKYPTTPLCRQRFIVDYFGEAVGDWVCRVCDRCTSHDHAERREPTAAENSIIVAILTAVQELNGRFGRSRIAQVLAGSKNAEVMRFGLNRRNSYGALSQCDQPLLIKMIDSLRDGGCLATVGETKYPVISLTDLGREVMAGSTTVPLVFHSFDEVKPKTSKSQRRRKNGSGTAKKTARAASTSGDMLDDDFTPDAGMNDLYERLCELRTDIATRRRLLPYQVFHNETLRQLADQTPLTAAEARSIKGIGGKKERTLLPQFLAEIEKWRQENAG